MTTSSEKIGHYQITGNPAADWSHATALLDSWFVKRNNQDLSIENAAALESGFRQRLRQATGVDELSAEVLALAKSLASQQGNDISYWPGGENYKVSLASSANASSVNPLGLPGDLWGAVSPAEDGALVSALVALSETGELSIMVPDGAGWEPLVDLSIIEGDTMVGMLPEAVQLYQKYDRDNTLGVVASYPLSETGPYPSMEQLAVPMPKEIMPLREDDPRRTGDSSDTSEEVEEGVEVEEEPEVEPEDTEVEEEETEEEEAVTAAVTLDSADDLTSALDAATRDPDLRWYVERRIAALGLETALPWQNN